jgi:hypothetical protein
MKGEEEGQGHEGGAGGARGSDPPVECDKLVRTGFLLVFALVMTLLTQSHVRVQQWKRCTLFACCAGHAPSIIHTTLE